MKNSYESLGRRVQTSANRTARHGSLGRHNRLSLLYDRLALALYLFYEANSLK